MIPKIELRLCILTIKKKMCKIQNRKATACPKDRQEERKFVLNNTGIRTEGSRQIKRSSRFDFGDKKRSRIKPVSTAVRQTEIHESGRSPKQGIITVRKCQVTVRNSPQTITVAEWFTQWLPIIEKQVRANTFRTYKGNMINHIIPYFEQLNLTMDQVTYRHIQAYYDSKVNELSATSIRHHAENMSKAFDDGSISLFFTRITIEAIFPLSE